MKLQTTNKTQCQNSLRLAFPLKQKYLRMHLRMLSQNVSIMLTFFVKKTEWKARSRLFAENVALYGAHRREDGVLSKLDVVILRYENACRVCAVEAGIAFTISS